MKKMNQLWLALLLTVLVAALLAVGFTAAAQGETPEIVDSGYCGGEGDGTNLTWTLSSDGVLTVSGDGAMADGNRPWCYHIDVIDSIVIEDGVISIGKSAFSGCFAQSVSIPDSVTSIGDNAFELCSLKAVVIPNGVTVISQEAFRDCASLSEVKLPENLKEIGDKAFYGCCQLESIEIPENVISIGENAFGECDTLGNIILPDVPDIGKDAFNDTAWFMGQPDGMVYLGNVAVGYKGDMPNNTEFSVKDGTKVIAGGAFATYFNLIAVTLPEGLTSIGEYAFWCTSITDVTIPDSVTTIGDCAFEASYLESATIPAGLETVGKEAFYGVRISEVILPEGLTTVGDYAFWGCNISHLSIPASLSSIGVGAFGMNACTEINVAQDNPVVCVDENGCLCSKDQTKLLVYPSGLADAEFSVPQRITKLGAGAFAAAKHLERVNLTDGLTEIENRVFSHCKKLTGIVIPDSVTAIGTEAFCGCTSLRSAVLSSRIANIPASMFSNCKYLTDVTIPEGVVSIGKEVFKYCEVLTSVELPESLKEIGYGAFWGCYKLTDITIPSGVVSMGEYTFALCKTLESIKIPDSLAVLGHGIFYDCTALTSVYLPTSLTEIGNQAFSDCDSLNDVYYTGSEEQWNAISIGNWNTPLTEATIHFNCHEHTAADPIRENEIPATCTTAGSYDEVIYCTRCNYEFSRESKTVEARGHSWGEWEVVEQATTEETGLMRRMCQNDPSHVEERVIPKLELDENNEPTSAIQAFIDSITSFFRGIIDWFLRLFRRP